MDGNNLPDYYQVLGVLPIDDQATLRSALRKKAMVHHPDRGGSVEEMKKINEAWEILSDPEKRHRYDESRANPDNVEASHASYQDAQQAKQQADDFPRVWSEYEAWINTVAQDFKQAKYGQTKPDKFIPFIFPTVENSNSGCLFIVVGAILVGWLIGLPVYHYLSDLSPGSAIKSNHPFRLQLFPLFCSMATVTAGAWLGKGLHQVIADSFKLPKTTEPAPVQPTVVETCIVACDKCHQKLREEAIVNNLCIDLNLKSITHKIFV